MTVRFLDICPHVSQPFAVIHHLHHVTRDAYTDFSTNAHGVEFGFVWRRIVLHIARRVACVAVVDATAVTRNVAEGFSIEDSEAISVPDFRRSISQTLWKHRQWC